MTSLLIVDDEALARQGLEIHLSQLATDLNIVSCGDCYAAQDALAQQHFDAMFLDIDLPGISGFAFLDEMQRNQQKIPPVIFTTGHIDFALKAFDYPVLDYLLKPIDTAHLKRAIAKLNQQQHLATQPQQGKSQPQQSVNSTLSLKNGAAWLQLPVNDVLWIEAAGDYMCVHTPTENHILRTTLRALELQLKPYRFVRINRSSLVNLENVTLCKPAKNGSYHVQLNNQQELRVSRKYKMLLDEASERYLSSKTKI
ncbi:LytTR family DNA-binding domain-containing protein [Alteromonas sp. ASW11-36]|uniref:LytTR family DNA-binding domain-containing protein n=1 Tax=Alteromonas arenosi TaxID=3055817 RepID=A0ABT7T2E7_9ALTE|nr:LytTR family DNA-binding domain-containing protein [Alteromonas sp. ASW11-36]MDM7861929.1 LytTR family DNA-binding domain-containing protein [Alteromonas sp. ASW11-36]